MTDAKSEARTEISDDLRRAVATGVVHDPHGHVATQIVVEDGYPTPYCDTCAEFYTDSEEEQ
ncbi:hypothetical protein C5B90_06500 [Haloferax sp. Atlit-12N]|uniref:hypothetical protein n=1 Tax=Haloferax sp. Atlit-12N TaxID=2077203 RepID=UPI000E238C28|nr:hypothetical protein [Haloferax sp. Atlit-12N]RDZ65991.1 hypothetical protein C5B90_06500 [Haloferax sp. Atlit-12N]